MRYTKAALLIFGFGLLLGLAIVVGEFSEWERTASAVMALGLVLLPLALFADGNGPAALRWVARRLSHARRKTPRGKPRSSARRRNAVPRPAGHRARR